MLMGKRIAAVTLIAAALIAGVVYTVRFGGKESVVFNEETNETKEAQDPAAVTDPDVLDQDLQAGSEALRQGAGQASVGVYCCGQVREAGVYFLSEGARIVDAVNAAGGFTEDAAADWLNLAEPVSDGMKIYVPSLKEVAEGTVPSESARSYGNRADALVNINTADEAQLMTLPGIGERRAQEIVAYRKLHGSFASIEDICNVSGIKDSVFEKIRDRICVK